MNRITLLLLGLLIAPVCTFAQQVISGFKTLEWADTLVKEEFSDYRNHLTYSFEGAAYREADFGYLPFFGESVRLPYDGALTVTVTDETYEPFTNLRLRPAGDVDSRIPNAVVALATAGYEKGKPVADVSILPIRRNGSTGQIEKLVSFRYHINIMPSASASLRGGDYADHSVLSTGTWFKIGVTKNGIHKIDKAFLQNLGVDVNSIDPRNIRIYGNGGGMLPESNAAFRYDDLEENAIKVTGQDDGHFDDGDYIQFYARGPDQWSYDTTAKKFYHIKNIYTDTSYYFLTTDLGTGKRVADLQNSGTPNQFITTFDDYAFHELEANNFIASGRRWYGEAFEFETSQTFPFNFPSIVTSNPVKFTMTFVGKSYYGDNKVSLLFNGQTIVTGTIGKVCSDFTCPFANEITLTGQFTATSPSVNVQIDFNRMQQDGQGWLNYIELNATRNLTWIGSQYNFRSVAAVGEGNVSQFTITNANSSVLVWDVSDPLNPENEMGQLAGTQLQFTSATEAINEFVMFASTEGYNPVAIGKIDNQDLHGLSAADLIIISPAFLLTQAQELADYHAEHDGMKAIVADQAKIFNEFSSGASDLSALRDFVRMFYVRANGDTTLMPKYLLLFGDGSFDNKGILPNNKSIILTYESPSSLKPVDSYVSDDFFGLLDATEGDNLLDNNEKLDVAVGRLTVNTADEAEAVINKIKVYSSSQSFGNWRNWITFVADDQDNNTHIKDAETICNATASAYPVYNYDKIYLDAYQQVSVPGGQRYPDVNTAINNRVSAGCLLMNYIGHGGVGGWAHERILGISDIQNYTNLNKLILYVTATCEFTQYDNPPIPSAGEYLLLNANGGAIGLVTTVRLVYSSANKEMNSSFMEEVLLPDANGIIPPIGEVFRRGKNASQADAVNNRKFTLIGDPAVTLAYPTFGINTTSINGHNVTVSTDTMRALQKVTVQGTVNNLDGTVMTSFNGTIYPTVFDKSVTYQTLANDGDSQVKSFNLQKNVIYNGKASVKDGTFTFSFIVPKDISYQFGFGKLSYYADNGSIDAHGYKNDVVIGGINDSAAIDVDGPVVKVYMNDEKFVTGGITDANPTVLVRISDTSGVNTVGTGIGHDITGVLDDDTKNTLVMNNFYSSDLDSYSAGEVRYPLSSLSEGLHHIEVKAWDVYNNSAEGFTDFIVASSAQMALSHVFNYPNPFTTNTEFMFEHNMPSQMLDVLVQIYTVSGKLIKTIQQTVIPETISSTGQKIDGEGGYRVNGIHWDGKDDFGDNIGKGVYVYKLTVKANNGMSAETYQKLVVLK